MEESQETRFGAHQILARKYRPQTFDEVIGQKAIIDTLRNALRTRRLAQAYIFSGMRGVGKTTVARLLAKALNCEKGPTPDPCNVCQFCTAIREDRAVDVLEIDGASYRRVEEISPIRDAARIGPIHSRYKVIIIDEVHMLSTHAFNSLLKTLEEPPPSTIFILATTEFHKVPLTIVSRCQHFEFKRISQKEIADHLLRIAEKENISLTRFGAQLLAEAADGSLRDAESLLDKALALYGSEIIDEKLKEVLGLVPREILFEASSLIFEGKAELVFPFVNKLVYGGYDLKLFYEELLRHFRNLLVVMTTENSRDILLLSSEEIESLRKEAQKVSSADLIRYLQILLQAEAGLRYTAHPQIYLESLLVRLCHVPHLVPLKEIFRSLEEGKFEEMLRKAVEATGPVISSEKGREEREEGKIVAEEPASAKKKEREQEISSRINNGKQAVAREKETRQFEEETFALKKEEIREEIKPADPRPELGSREKEAILEMPAVKSFVEYFKGRIVSIDPLPRPKNREEV